jgi:nicotinamide mononucleotide (NMN) deamidase PncC
MAQGVRRLASSALGAAVTGVAGPTPDSAPGAAGPKPVGLVFIAVADESGCVVKERQFLGERDRIRLQAAQMALDLIRRKLLGG